MISFSELFINSNTGQAIAYIGNSSLGFTSTSITFPDIFYKNILKDSILNIGEAHKFSKLELLQDYGSSGVYKVFTLTNHLIGDPIISLPIPQKPNLKISGKDIRVLTSDLSDSKDSAKVLFKFYNWGKVIQDSFLIIIIENYQGNTITVDSFYKPIPRFEDSLLVSFQIYNKPGEHSITISLDENYRIDELSEDDNIFTLQFYVTSSRIRTLFTYELENSVRDSLLIINPSEKSFTDSIEIEMASNPDYMNSSFFYLKMDSVFTTLNFPNEYLNKRIWLRGKIEEDDFVGFNESIFTGVPSKYMINDFLSLTNSNLNHLGFNDDIITIDTNKTDFRIISAGFNDGKTAVIEKNGENFCTWRKYKRTSCMRF